MCIGGDACRLAQQSRIKQLGAEDAGSHVESLTVEGVWLAVGAAAVDTVPEKGVNPVVQWLQLRQVRDIVFGSHVAAIDAAAVELDGTVEGTFAIQDGSIVHHHRHRSEHTGEVGSNSESSSSPKGEAAHLHFVQRSPEGWETTWEATILPKPPDDSDLVKGAFVDQNTVDPVQLIGVWSGHHEGVFTARRVSWLGGDGAGGSAQMQHHDGVPAAPDTYEWARAMLLAQAQEDANGPMASPIQDSARSRPLRAIRNAAATLAAAPVAFAAGVGHSISGLRAQRHRPALRLAAERSAMHQTIASELQRLAPGILADGMQAYPRPTEPQSPVLEVLQRSPLSPAVARAHTSPLADRLHPPLPIYIYYIIYYNIVLNHVCTSAAPAKFITR